MRTELTLKHKRYQGGYGPRGTTPFATMPHPLLCPIILSCIFFAFPTITALVPLGVFQPLQRQIRFRKERGVGVLVVAYSTKESDPVVDKLFQRDPDIDAPLPPAFIDCPFTGILGGPDAFYRTASRALQSPSLFSFLYQDRPMVEVTGGSNARRLLRQENFSNLTSNAVPGVSQMVCGTSSLRTVTDKSRAPGVARIDRRTVVIPPLPWRHPSRAWKPSVDSVSKRLYPPVEEGMGYLGIPRTRIVMMSW